MSKVKDLGKAVILALGLTGLGASVSSCVPMVAAGAGAYAGTKMAQKGGADEDLVENFNAEVCYKENGKEECVCGGNLYKNSSAGYYVLKGFDPSQALFEEGKKWNCSNDTSCDVCLSSYQSRTFSFSNYRGLRESTWRNSGKPDSSSRGQINYGLDDKTVKEIDDWATERANNKTNLSFERWKKEKETGGVYRRDDTQEMILGWATERVWGETKLDFEEWKKEKESRGLIK